MSFDLSGRSALVTGSTRGLGLAFARALAEAGARVVVNGRSPEAAAEVAASIDGAVAAAFDVTDEAAVATAVGELGPVVANLVRVVLVPLGPRSEHSDDAALGDSRLLVELPV